jgi:hypothetical protein
MSGVWLAQSHAAANKVPYSEKTPMREATKQPVSGLSGSGGEVRSAEVLHPFQRIARVIPERAVLVVVVGVIARDPPVHTSL